MIRKIILENFMSHAHTVIDLADGLTVLTGPNNCGKSAVVAALQILATNGRTTHVMRHGEKVCRITVETDDQHTISWERKNKTVKYTLDGEDIHRTGASVPDSLHDLLRLDRVSAEAGKTTYDYDIHFGEQKSPVFLLNESSSRAASFFASSSDASRLLEMQFRHRTRLREKRSEAKRLAAEIETNAARLKGFETVDSIADSLQRAEKAQQQISSVEKQIQRLRQLVESLDRKGRECRGFHDQLGLLNRLNQATTNPSELERAEQRLFRLRSVVQQKSHLLEQIRTVRQQVKTLGELATPPMQHDAGGLSWLVNRLQAASAGKQTAVRIHTCCSAIVAPPPQEPAAACRAVLEQLVTTSKRKVAAQLAMTALRALQPAPQLSDTRDLRLLLGKLVGAAERQQHASRLHASCAALQRPPAEVQTDRLQQLISYLAQKQTEVARWQAATNQLSRVRPPAEAIDPDSLITMLARLGQAMQQVAATRRRAEAASQSLTACEQQIRTFVAANPKCETCGGSIDPETLMSTVPQFHDHTPVERPSRNGLAETDESGWQSQAQTGGGA